VLYTKTGDDGETGLFGNKRVPKDSVRIEAYGTLDELNGLVGLVRCEPLDPHFDACLLAVQNMLFEIGADLATEGGRAAVAAVRTAIAEVGRWIDASEAELTPLRSFVLRAGMRAAALLHVVRAVCRRAERRYWTLARSAPDTPREYGVYLNRLSDLCF